MRTSESQFSVCVHEARKRTQKKTISNVNRWICNVAIVCLLPRGLHGNETHSRRLRREPTVLHKVEKDKRFQQSKNNTYQRQIKAGHRRSEPWNGKQLTFHISAIPNYFHSWDLSELTAIVMPLNPPTTNLTRTLFNTAYVMWISSVTRPASARRSSDGQILGSWHFLNHSCCRRSFFISCQHCWTNTLQSHLYCESQHSR